MKPGWMDRRLLSSIKLLHKTPLRDAPISRSRLNDQFLLSFVFWDQFQHGEGVPHPQASLQTPAGCPTILFSSDSLYLETASDSTC